MEHNYYPIIALFLGFFLDLLLADPAWLPHPIVGFGKLIRFFDQKFNSGKYRFWKGAFSSLFLIIAVFLVVGFVDCFLTSVHPIIGMLFKTVVVFFSLSGLTLRREVRQVFVSVNRSLKEGREALSRIVGRDTANLNEQQVRSAALETLSENLSDGSIAPLFWFAVLGVPGMAAYKMVNTLDSMIGYKNARYFYFGKFAARADDLLNLVPARISALLMLIVSGKLFKIREVFREGRNHTSPNSGYPEAALATILGCRFGGPNFYEGVLIDKPFIGKKEKQLSTHDMLQATDINLYSEIAMVVIVAIVLFI